MPGFEDKLAAALAGAAIGDAMGAPVEGRSPEEIRARLGEHDFTTFLPGREAGRGKGEGRITDDTLMTEALLRAYTVAGRHLDAYGYLEYVLPEVRTRRVWVPERQEEMPIFDRLYWPEKFPWQRLALAHADPRTAGVGNMVNCGLAMFIMPVGAVNAGDPGTAYLEAAALGGAHNESYAIEAAAVLAAAYAGAFSAEASLNSVLNIAASWARDGTAAAIHAAVAAAEPGAPVEDFIRSVRGAVAPFDGRREHTADDDRPGELRLSDAGRPSRTRSIEELPVALAALRHGGGDFVTTLRAAVRYGRDCDSIAAMAGGLCAALNGTSCLPAGLRVEIDRANRRNFAALAAEFAGTVRRIHVADQLRAENRRRALGP